MRRNERDGQSYKEVTLSLLAPFVLSTLLLSRVCSDQGNVNPVPLGGAVPQPTPDLLSFREGAGCRELMERIEGAYNERYLAPYDGKYYIKANPLEDGTALRVLVLTSVENFEENVEKFEDKLRKGLSETGVEYFPVEYYRVKKKVEGGGAIVDESVESITIGERGNFPGCYSPAPAASTASPSS